MTATKKVMMTTTNLIYLAIDDVMSPYREEEASGVAFVYIFAWDIDMISVRGVWEGKEAW